MKATSHAQASSVECGDPGKRRTRRSPARAASACAAVLLTALAAAGCGSSGGSSSSGSGSVSSGPGVVQGIWGGVLKPSGSPVHGGTLTIDQQMAPLGISPLYILHAPDNQSIQVVDQLFDQLVEFLPGSIDPQPGLAKRWTVSPNGLTYTFYLRQTSFSNGMPVTSADVKYLLDFARGPQSFFTNLFGMIKSVSTPDPLTAVVHLSAPTPGFIYSLGTMMASIVPAKVVEKEGVAKFNQHPIGSGPFILQNWKRSQEVDLVRNPHYWRTGMPYVSAVHLIATPSDNTRTLDIESGTVDVADYPTFSQIQTIDAGGKARVLVAHGADMNVIWMNNAKPPLNETAVRQALCYATPVNSIINVVYHHQAPQMNTIIPKLKYWTDQSKAYPYDVAKAKQLLATTRYPHGFSATIDVEGTDSLSLQEAQILQQTWAEIGVKLHINQVDVASQSNHEQNGTYQLQLFPPGAYTSDVPVDDEFAALLFNSPQTHNLFTWYQNPVTAKLAHEATTTLSDSGRVKLFAQMDVASMKDPSVCPVVYTPNRAAVANNVHNFNYLLGGYWRLDRVWLDSAG